MTVAGGAEPIQGTGEGGKVRLLLVGAGHAHMEIVRRLAAEPRQDVALTVVSQAPQHHYSGMVPGYLQGTYREEEIAFELAPLVAVAGGSFRCARAVGVDPAERAVEVEGGASLPYDLVSFNVGSRTVGQDDPSVARHAALVKPMSRAVELERRIRRLASRPAEERRAAVVGGGAAGVEVACAVATVLAGSDGGGQVTLLEASPSILDGYSETFRRRGEAILARRGIRVRTDSPVARVGPEAVALEDGTQVPSRLTVWLTGAAGPPLFATSGLPLDERGFLLVDDSLRSVADRRIFAVGDCGTLASHPETPKAGVYAVRQGPVLWQSLTAALEGGEPPRYEPQGSFLSILNTGDGKALLRYKGVVSHSRWAWWLKDWIDRRFMEKYQRLTRGRPTPRG